MLKRILAGTMGVSMILTSLATDSFNRLNADESDTTKKRIHDTNVSDSITKLISEDIADNNIR